MGKVEKIGIIKFDIALIQKGLTGEFIGKTKKEKIALTEDDIRKYFQDGRRVSFIIERSVAKILGGKLAESEKKGYDIILQNGEKWEIRSITKRGVYFTPSNQVGKGRKFDEEGFKKKLDDIKGYILADVTNFPEIVLYMVPSEVVRQWWGAGKLGKTAKVSYSTIKELLERSLG